MSPRSSKEENKGRGRRRGEFHDAEELKQEERAKGHEHRSSRPGAGEPPEISEPNTERGRQKGYGKNQDEEGRSRHTRFGTRAPGSEHG